MTEQTPQRELFDGSPSPLRETEAHAPSSPAETRRAAGKSVWPRLNQLQRRVLRFIRERGPRGASDHEIAAGLDMLLDTVRARRVELRDLGAIAPSGRTRRTPSGRQATVWILSRDGDHPQRAEVPTGAGHDRPSTAAARGASASGSAGVQACAWCGRAEFWLSRYGVWVCEHCHPPAVPELVVDRCEAVEVRKPR